MIIERPGEYDIRITDEDVSKGYANIKGMHHMIRSESTMNISLAISELERICDKHKISHHDENLLAQMLSAYSEEAAIIKAPEYISMPIRARITIDLESSTYIAEDAFFSLKNKKTPFCATGQTPRQAMRNLYEVMKGYHKMFDGDPKENFSDAHLIKQYLDLLFIKKDYIFLLMT